MSAFTRSTNAQTVTSDGNTEPTARKKVGHGDHTLRSLRGVQLDVEDLAAVQRRELRAAALRASVVAALNLFKCVMDILLFLSFVGYFNEFDGKVETSDAFSLIHTLFVGLFMVPGFLAHCVFGCFVMVDLQQLVSVNRDALGNLSRRGLWVSGVYFVVCTLLAFFLLASPIQVVTTIFKAVYVLVCLSGVAVTVVGFRLKEAARKRIALRHAVPANRSQVFALRTMVE